MKNKTYIKIICTIYLICFMTTNVFAVANNAIENLGYYGGAATETMREVQSGTNDEIVAEHLSQNIDYVTVNNEENFYYSQLNSAQKNMYNLLDALELPKTETIEYTYEEKSVRLDIKDSYPTVEEKNELESELRIELRSTVYAYVYDNPEFFWMSGYNYSWYWNVASDDSGYYIYVSSAKITINIHSSYKNLTNEEIITEYNKAINVVSSVKITGDSRYEKIKSIHDTICRMVVYDYDFNEAHSHQPTGVFLDGVAVCEGYAEAFKMLCDRAGIPCISILSTNHMWNDVMLENGKWYAVDVTWDDASRDDYIFYDYFIIGQNTESDVFYCGQKFFETHVELPLTRDLSYPTIENETYPYLFNIEGKSLIDKNENTIKILPNAYIDDSVYCLNLPLRFTSSGTGSELKIGSETYTIIMTGDADGDGIITTTDAREILRNAAGITNSKGIYKIANDIDGDGMISVCDARTALKISVGLKQNVLL